MRANVVLLKKIVADLDQVSREVMGLLAEVHA